jgi:hypothetical protein
MMARTNLLQSYLVAMLPVNKREKEERRNVSESCRHAIQVINNQPSWNQTHQNVVGRLPIYGGMNKTADVLA